MHYRLPPVLQTLLAAGFMYVLARRVPVIENLNSYLVIVSFVLWFIASVLISSSIFSFLKKGTTVNPMSLHETQSLVVSGLYRYTRNPMYLGFLILLVSFAFFLNALSPFLVIPLFVFCIQKTQIELEEVFLAEKFGESYLQYKQKVKRWL
ncbi:MAG: isoprenylcysteine carboxylmethyltransferase family protein [Oligoflexales bacterium]|nr:isoprenylcysteine carboxylmethyltransferase family protein [Oligoflexales bacterium]